MANSLSKTGITTGNTVRAWHVTQSIDAFAGTEAYDITLSGSLTYDDGNSGINKVLVDSDGAGLLTYTNNLNITSVTASFSGSFTGNGTNLTTVGNGSTTFSGSFTGSFSGSTSATLSNVVTNGNTLSNGQFIQSLNGNGYLNLREGGDSIILLSNDTGSYNDSGLHISPDYSAWYTDAWTTAWEVGIATVGSFRGRYTSFYSNLSPGTDNDVYFVISSGPSNKAPMGVFLGVALAEGGYSDVDMGIAGGGSTYQNILILSDATISSGSQQSSIISSGEQLLGASTLGNPGVPVSRSAIIGGYGISGTESDTVYVPQFRAGDLSKGWDIYLKGNTGISSSAYFYLESGSNQNQFATEMLSGSNYTQTFQAKTGVVAHLDDINNVTGSINISGSLTIGQNINYNTRNVGDANSDPNILATDCIIFFSSSISGGGTMNLPTSPSQGQQISFIRISGSFAAGIAAGGAYNINGSGSIATPTSVPSRVNMVLHGTTWWATSENSI